MQYSFDKTLDMSFDDAVVRVTEALKGAGFGMLTDIDVQATLKKKLDVDFRRYHILGACNPYFAHQALLTERRIGTMLPCNIVVQEADEGQVEVSAIDPVASMTSIKNPVLRDIAEEVQDRLKRVVDSL